MRTGHSSTRRRPASRAAHGRDRVVGTTRQLAGVTKRPSQIVGLQDFHDFLGRLQVVPPRERQRLQHASAPEEGPQPRDAARQTTSCRADPMAATGQFSCPPAGNYVAVSGQFLVAAVIRIHRTHERGRVLRWRAWCFNATPFADSLCVGCTQRSRQDVHSTTATGCRQRRFRYGIHMHPIPGFLLPNCVVVVLTISPPPDHTTATRSTAPIPTIQGQICGRDHTAPHPVVFAPRQVPMQASSSRSATRAGS